MHDQYSSDFRIDYIVSNKVSILFLERLSEQDFGSKNIKKHLIDTMEKLQSKIELVESLLEVTSFVLLVVLIHV